MYSLKGDYINMHIHLQLAAEHTPPSSSGSGKIMRAQAEALRWELDHNAKPNPTVLYRGDIHEPHGVQAWSEKRNVAEHWAKMSTGLPGGWGETSRGGQPGQVYKLPVGTASGLRIADYIKSGADEIEKEWVVDSDAQKAERVVEFKVDRNAAKGKAAKKLDAAEAEFQAIVHRWLDRMTPVITSKLQGTKARRDTRHWKPPGEVKLDPNNAIDAERWRAELEQDVLPFLEKLTNHFYGSTLKAIEATTTKAKKPAPPKQITLALGPGETFAKRSARLRKAIKAHTTSIGDFSDTVVEGIRNTIAKTEERGFSIGDIASAIADYVDENSDFWAERVARTEIVGAANEAAHAAAADSGVVNTKKWLSTDDPRTRPSHVEMDGEEVPVDEAFSNGLMFPGDQNGTDPGEVVNCFPGSTLVDSVGAITGAVRRRYDGPMLRLVFASGNELSVTPNHPLLTTHGWAAAGSLAVGDNLLRACVRERMTLGDPDVQHVPALLGEVVDALARNGSIERVLRSDVNLHGDTPNSDVDVVRANGQLRNPLQPGTGEFVAEPEFTSADLGLRSFAGRGLASELDVAGRARAARDVGSQRSSLTLDLGHAGSAQHVLIADASRLDSRLAQPANYDLAADAVTLAQAGLGFAALVEADKLVDVDVVAFHGDVFTLETSLGWYTANSVLARNCRCTMLMGIGGDELDILGSDYTEASAEAQFKDWNEADHPRDANGEFGAGGGGDSGGGGYSAFAGVWPISDNQNVMDMLVPGSSDGDTALENYQADGWTERSFDVGALVAGQDANLSDKNVAQMVKNGIPPIDADQPPMVARVNGVDVLMDGHNRAVAAAQRGEPMRALFKDIGNVDGLPARVEKKYSPDQDRDEAGRFAEGGGGGGSSDGPTPHFDTLPRPFSTPGQIKKWADKSPENKAWSL